MNFTKELKHPSPEPRVDLAKALKFRPAITDDHGEVHEAAGLIKALHQTGGDDLLKIQPSGRRPEPLAKAPPTAPAQEQLRKLVDAAITPLRKRADALQTTIEDLKARTAPSEGSSEPASGLRRSKPPFTHH